MSGNDFQKLKSVEIPYKREELEEIVETLFSDPQYIDKKNKTLDLLDKIERKINKIRGYQKSTYPKNFYLSMKNLLLKIKNVVNEIDRKTKKHDEILPNTLKKLILDYIKPLEEALKNLEISLDVIVETKRLYAQQSFVCRQSNLQEELMRHLNNIKKFLKGKNRTPPYCYISYAWPSEGRKEEEYWVQPFLYVLYDHLKAAGIRVVMDIRDNEPGESIVAFTKKYNDGNYIILVGTQSLLEKHHAEKNHVIQSELNIIEKRFEGDKKQYGHSRIYPLLISGTIETAYPERYRGYVTTKDPRGSDYLKMLKDLMDWIYKFRLKHLKRDDQYADLWNACFNFVSKLPHDESAVEKEVSRNYHKPRYIEELKQKKKKQKSNEEDKISGIPDRVLPELTPMFDGSSELPIKANKCDECSDSSNSNEVSTKVSSNKKLTDAKFNEVPEVVSEIINVSGFDNCCGLFALALGVKIAMREKGANEKNQLDFLSAIDEEALKSTTVHTATIAKQLKEEMYRALLLNEAYKEQRLHSFTDYCRAELEGGVLSEDMSSFSEANQDYREELKALWLSVQEAIEKQFERVEAEYSQYLETDKVKESSIDEIKEILSLLVINSPGHEEVSGLIRDSFEEEACLLYRLIKFNRLYRSAWFEIEAGTAEQRNRLDELYTKILNEKSIALLEKEQGEGLIIALLKLSFLQKTSFECNGELEKICDKKEIISTAIFLLVSVHTKKKWDLLYENYCNYIKENNIMLSTDELGCLALRWKVQLKIQFGSRQLYETHQEDGLRLLQVILCNPNQDHWQVYYENRNKPIKEINSSSDEALTKLNSDELLTSNESPRIGFLDCEEEVAELATLSDKQKIEVNQKNRNEETSLIFAAKNGHETKVAQLLEKGANVNQADEQKWILLMIAVQMRYQKEVVALLLKDVDVKRTDEDGKTLLYIAASNGHVSVVKQLLKKGADVNQANKDGETSLLIAVANGHLRVVIQLLKKKGVNVNQARRDRCTPLTLAIKGSYFKIAALLLKAGAEIKNEQKENIALLYPRLQEWLRSGEYEACLILSEYKCHQEPGLRIDERVDAYYARGKLNEARAYLKTLKSKDQEKDRAFISHKRGYIKMEEGKLDSAIKHYEAALREDKDNDRILYDRMLAELYKTGNPEAILKKLEELPNPKVFQNKPDAVYSYHVKGFIYHQCLQHDKALVCFNEALKRDEEDIFALAKRGFLFFCQKEKEKEKGFEDLDAALAINPYYSGALARKGYGLALEKRFDEAGKYFKRSLQVNSTHFETLLLKGISLILQRRMEEAEQCIERTRVVSFSRSSIIAKNVSQKTKESIKKRVSEYESRYKKKFIPLFAEFSKQSYKPEKAAGKKEIKTYPKSKRS